MSIRKGILILSTTLLHTTIAYELVPNFNVSLSPAYLQTTVNIDRVDIEIASNNTLLFKEICSSPVPTKITIDSNFDFKFPKKAKEIYLAKN